MKVSINWQTFSAAVFEEMAHRKVSHTELAKQAGLNRSTISFLKEKKRCSADNFVRLLIWLGDDLETHLLKEKTRLRAERIYRGENPAGVECE